MKSSEPLRGFSGSRRYTLTVIPPLPQPVTTALAAGRLTHALCLEAAQSRPAAGYRHCPSGGAAVPERGRQPVRNMPCLP
ncbi:MAG: hypothetical protein ACLTY5_03875 [Angelakisella sp.]